MPLPCTNRCGTHLNASTRLPHEKACPHQTIKCQFMECKFSDNLVNLIAHINETHGKQFIAIKPVEFDYKCSLEIDIETAR